MKKTKKILNKFDKALAQITDAVSAYIIADILANPKWNNDGKSVSQAIIDKSVVVALITETARKAIDLSNYNKIVKELITSSREMLTDIQAINAINGVSGLLTGNLNVLKALETTDLKIFTGLTDDMLNKLQRTLNNVVLSGMTDRQMIIEIKAIVGDDFQRYVKAYAQTSRTTYLQRLEDITADRYNKDNSELFWEYVGPEDNKNRDICIDALDQRFFTEDERLQFELINGIRYNCRHIFVNITKDAYDTKEIPESDLTQEEKDRRKKIVEVMNG